MEKGRRVERLVLLGSTEGRRLVSVGSHQPSQHHEKAVGTNFVDVPPRTDVHVVAHRVTSIQSCRTKTSRRLEKNCLLNTVGNTVVSWMVVSFSSHLIG